MSVRLQACVWTATASTRRDPSAVSVWLGWQWAWMDVSVLVSQCFVSRNGLCAHFGFMANGNLTPVSVENQNALKAATRNFCLLLILSPPVDKIDMNTTTSCWKGLDLNLSLILFFFWRYYNELFLFLVDSGGPRQMWGWKKVNFVLVPYHQTAEQLLSSGCETPQFIISCPSYRNSFNLRTYQTQTKWNIDASLCRLYKSMGVRLFDNHLQLPRKHSNMVAKQKAFCNQHVVSS